MSDWATSGWFLPRAASRMASARSWSGSARLVQPLVLVEDGEVVERLGDVGMVLAEGRFPNGERALNRAARPGQNLPDAGAISRAGSDSRRPLDESPRTLPPAARAPVQSVQWPRSTCLPFRALLPRQRPAAPVAAAHPAAAPRPPRWLYNTGPPPLPTRVPAACLHPGPIRAPACSRRPDPIRCVGQSPETVSRGRIALLQAWWTRSPGLETVRGGGASCRGRRTTRTSPRNSTR